VIIDKNKLARLAKSAGDHAASRTAAHDDEVVLSVRQRPGQRTAARVFDVALGPDENLQQAHEQHERRPAARARQRRTRLGHRTVAVAIHAELVLESETTQNRTINFNKAANVLFKVLFFVYFRT